MQQVTQLKGVYKTNYNLRHLTWFKTGGNAVAFFKPFDLEELRLFLAHNTTRDELVTVIGAGSNMIIRDGGIDGVVIKLGNNFSNIELNDHGQLIVGASCLNFNLAKFCHAHSIAGFEFLIGIPGTIGGGVVMNAGAYGREFQDIILSIEVVDHNGNIFIIKNDEINFAYRCSNLPPNLIVTKAVLHGLRAKQEQIGLLMSEIRSTRLATQPVKERTGGSSFANPTGYKAWQLIDQCGLRGYKMGGAGMSELHCNFMINYGDATSHDLETLGEFVRENVYKATNILLEWEIKIIGKKSYYA